MKKTPFLKLSAFIFALFCLPLATLAQTNVAAPVETLWTTGKIFVVLIIAAVIFSGIGFFLIILERKISRVEKKISEKTQ